MNPKPLVRFHLGAHKTATTYMQSRLRCNLNNLLENGIRYVDLWASNKHAHQIRGWIRQVVWKGDDKNRDLLVESLRELTPELKQESESSGIDTLILSYENILGTYHLAKTPRLYTELSRGLSLLDEAYGMDNMEFFFSYRAMDKFIESCYLQCIHTQKESRTFETFLSEINLSDLSWLDTIRRISDLTGKSRLRIWPYERFRQKENEIWQALLGRKNPERLIKNEAKKQNPSLTKEAVECLRTANTMLERADARRLSNFLKDNISTDKGYTPARYLSDEQRKAIRDRSAAKAEEITSLAQLLI